MAHGYNLPVSRATQEYQDVRDGRNDWTESDNTVPDTTDQAVADYRDETFEQDVIATDWSKTFEEVESDAKKYWR